MRNKIINYLLLLPFLFTNEACRKIIEIDPPKNQITPANVFSNDASVTAALVNIYSDLNAIDDNFIKQADVYSDDLIYLGGDMDMLEYNSSILSTKNSSVSNIWSSYYFLIYQSNLIIEGLVSSIGGLTDSIRTRSIGEAKFLRAYCYFNLANIYKNVPLITTTDVRYSATAHRASESEIYTQIITDLVQAQNSLSALYPANEKTRVNRYAAKALLAKVYLYMADWSKAEQKSSEVLISGLYNLETLNEVFLYNNNEAIWQIWNENGFSNIGISFTSFSGVPNFIFTPELLAAFEPSDQRFTGWTNEIIVSGISYRYPAKYKNTATTIGALAEYTVKLRLSEQFFIRAEARAMNNNAAGAIEDINTIRSRAGVGLITMPLSKDSILSVIQRERQAEFFGEEGNRFFDLKRTNTIDEVMSKQKASWLKIAKYYPIPQNEIINNPALTQNPGY